MTLTGSEYGVQPPQSTQAHWRITRQAQPEDTTCTWSPLSHASSRIKLFCLVLSSTLLAMEPALSASIIICLEKKFISCQSSKELWAILRDGRCGTSLEIKKTDGSDRHSSLAVLSHFRYDPSKFWSVYFLHHKTLRVYELLQNLKAICNCLITFASKYVCRVFWGNM